MQALSLELEERGLVDSADVLGEQFALAALEKGNDICHVDNSHLALRDVNGAVSALFQLDKVVAADEEANERVDDVGGLVHDLDIRDGDGESPQ